MFHFPNVALISEPQYKALEIVYKERRNFEETKLISEPRYKALEIVYKERRKSVDENLEKSEDLII